MTSPLVATKLFVPRLRSSILDRSRLTSRLRARAEAKLTLVSAPAGFGKTTAVSAWLASPTGPERVVTWVSLDAGDAQAASFWTYVVAGLQGARPDVGATALPLLRSGQPPNPNLLATLVNEIGDQPVDIDLVLDDYHLADGPEVTVGMTYLLDHLPPNLHLVLLTRADPDLPLARLRAQGELLEIRARDLRFTETETAAYLREVGGLALERGDVVTLAERTEGWAAALQLATLSMQGREDVPGFVAGFAGDDRYVVDYLADEVLSRQSAEVRDFLLRTSVLDRLSADLCDAVTDQTGGRARLELLDRANLFLVALDDRREWYRYHHLFADVLQAHLDAELPGRARILHRRASDWYAQAGETVPAVRHALAAADHERAADLVEAAMPALGQERGEARLRAWVEDFPDDVIRRRPVLALGLVGGLMQYNDFEPAEALLLEVERWLPAIRTHLGLDPETDPDAAGIDPPKEADLAFFDEAMLARVPAMVAMYRAALALVHGEPAATLRFAHLALAQAGPGDHLVNGAAAGLSGLARWTAGDLEAAHQWYSRCVDELTSAGHLADVLGCTITLADLRLAQGRLTEAQLSYDDGMLLATADRTPLRGTADLHTGIAEIALERADLVTARRHLLLSQELGDALALGQNPYRLKAASAALAQAEGALTTAHELLVEAERVYLGDFSPDVRPLHARIARIDIARGDLDAALRWAAGHEVSASQDLSYAREFEHVTLAEVLLAQHRQTGEAAAMSQCHDLLGRLVIQADQAGRNATVLEVLVLLAMAADTRGDRDTAVRTLRRAVALAEPEGHVRVFARHGKLLTALLDTVVAPGRKSPYAARLRAAALQASSSTSPPGTTPRLPDAQPADALTEALSPRELDVLRLLASDLDGPDIARHLVVSLNTLRTHTKHIYTKLDVTTRRAALRRARERGLI